MPSSTPMSSGPNPATYRRPTIIRSWASSGARAVSTSRCSVRYAGAKEARVTGAPDSPTTASSLRRSRPRVASLACLAAIAMSHAGSRSGFPSDLRHLHVVGHHEGDPRHVVVITLDDSRERRGIALGGLRQDVTQRLVGGH